MIKDKDQKSYLCHENKLVLPILAIRVQNFEIIISLMIDCQQPGSRCMVYRKECTKNRFLSIQKLVQNQKFKGLEIWKNFTVGADGTVSHRDWPMALREIIDDESLMIIQCHCPAPDPSWTHGMPLHDIDG